MVVAGVMTIDDAVGAHDGGDTGVHRGCKWRQVDLVQRLRVHHHVGRALVADVVLGHGHDAAVLDAFDLRGADGTAQARILAKGVISAIKGGITLDIDERLEHHVDAGGPRIARDDAATGARIRQAEGCRQAEAAGQRRGGIAREYAWRAIGKPDRLHPEAGDAWQVACLSLVARKRFGCAVQQCNFFSERHARQQRIEPRIPTTDRHRGTAAGDQA